MKNVHLPDFRRNFKLNLKTIRKDYNLTQEKLAERLGVNRKTIGAIEEERALGIDVVYLVSKEFGYGIDILITQTI